MPATDAVWTRPVRRHRLAERGGCGGHGRPQVHMSAWALAGLLVALVAACGGGDVADTSHRNADLGLGDGRAHALAVAPGPGADAGSVLAEGGTYALRLAAEPTRYLDVAPVADAGLVGSRVLYVGATIPLSAQFAVMPPRLGTRWEDGRPAPSTPGCFNLRMKQVVRIQDPLFPFTVDPRYIAVREVDRYLGAYNNFSSVQRIVPVRVNQPSIGSSPFIHVCPVPVSGGFRLQLWTRGSDAPVLRLRNGVLEASAPGADATTAAESTWQVVVVRPPGNASAPTVRLSVPSPRLSRADIGNQMLSVEADDADGELLSVLIYDGARVLDASGVRPWDVPLVQGLELGAHRFYAFVTDHSGHTTASEPLDFELLPSPPPAGYATSTGTLRLDDRGSEEPPSPRRAGQPVPVSGRLSGDGFALGSVSLIELLDGDRLVADLTPRSFDGDSLFSWAGTPGNHGLRLRVTDVYGQVSLGPVLAVTVLPAEAWAPLPPLPVLSLVSAEGGSRGPEATRRMLRVDFPQRRAGDGSADPAYVSFYEGRRLLGSVSQAPYAIPWTGERGRRVLTAQAVTAQGQTLTSQGIPFEVTLGVPPPPRPDAQAPEWRFTVATPGATTENAPVPLSANVSGFAAGTVDRIEFYRVYPGAGSDSRGIFLASAHAAPYTAVWPRAERGSWVIRAKLYGASGDSGIPPVDSGTFNVAPATASVSAGLFQPRDRTALTLGQGLVLQGTATGADGTRATTARPRFLINGVEALPQSFQGNAFSHSWMPSAAGRYHIVASARDPASGAETLSRPVIVDVIAPGAALPFGTLQRAPEVTIRQPADGTAFAVGSLVSVEVDVRDPSGAALAGVSLQSATGKLTLRSPPWVFHWPARAGDLSVTAVAMDARGTMAFSASRSLRMVGAANQAPSVVIVAPSQSLTVTAGTVYTLQAHASDADGSVRSVEFFANGRSLGQASQSPWRVTGMAVQPGSYQLTARATDNQGAVSTSAAVTVQVLPAAGS